MARPNTILLDMPGVREEYPAAAGLSPGHLVEITSAGTVQKHSGQGGVTERMFAIEDELQGNGVTTAYATTDLVTVDIGLPGCRRLARLAANAAAVVIGDKLISAGDGTVKKAPSGGAAVLYENVAPSSNISNGVTTEQFFDTTYTLPANTLSVGDNLEIEGFAIVSASAGTDTLTVKVYVGGVAVLTTAAVDSANGDIVHFRAIVNVRTIGAGGTITVGGTYSNGPSASATEKPTWVGSTALDTTVANIIRASATWSATTATCTVAMQQLKVTRTRTAAGGPLFMAIEAVDNSAVGAEGFVRVRCL